MRVLIVADVVGGVKTFVDELTRGLTRRGIAVHLALLGQDAPEAARSAASCEVRELKLEWMSDPWPDVARTAEWVEQLRSDHQPDLVHMNTFAPVLDPEVPVLLTVHSCVLTWWRAVHGTDAPSHWTQYRQLARDAFDRADALCAPTRALLGELSLAHGELPPARVIPNGRSFTPPPVRRQDRLVVSVGRLWDEGKNAALIARAAPAVEGRVVLIGPGQAAGAEHLGPLTEHEVLRWLASAHVFAEPARYEPFGLAALEAALCGCALVLGDIPSLREVWGDAASFVSPDDPDELARALNTLLDDPSTRHRAANAARARAGRYTPSATADAYVDAYRQLTRAVAPA